MISKTDLPGNLHTALAHLATKSYTDGEECGLVLEAAGTCVHGSL